MGDSYMVQLMPKVITQTYVHTEYASGTVLVHLIHLCFMYMIRCTISFYIHVAWRV